ncbi:PAS domain-containing sensor histidine kinase [Raoultella terrigena]|uniref:sensor histidine kinase n=1 Tax=Raoultella terrigena TaxID=577 RepID=UPI00349F7B20
MMLRSNTLLRRLLFIWLSFAAVSITLGWLIFELSRQGADEQIRRERQLTAASCETLRIAATRAGLSADSGKINLSPQWVSGAQAVIDLTLRDRPGVEGGLWSMGSGVVAYAFPTYDGSGIKRDPPSAELERIESTSRRALDGKRSVTDVRPGLREAVIFSACPLEQNSALVAWTLSRVPTITGDALDRLVLAMALLLGFVLLSGSWLGWTLTRWSRGVHYLAGVLEQSRTQFDSSAPELAELSGLADLDRVTVALNDYSQRLAYAQRESARLSAELAQAEKLAALGELSAGLAHEIRNPLATIQMKAENALHAPQASRVARAESALLVVIEQTERINRLVSSLLALTQPFRVERQKVNIEEWLLERINAHADAAQRRQIDLTLTIDPELPAHMNDRKLFDPSQMARAFDNLILNALAHVANGGRIETGARRRANGNLLLWVADDGPGVSDELRARLFNPFITGRPDGYGLGLALVREIVHAHGGNISLADSARGARFEMELTWPEC